MRHTWSAALYIDRKIQDILAKAMKSRYYRELLTRLQINVPKRSQTGYLETRIQATQTEM